MKTKKLASRISILLMSVALAGGAMAGPVADFEKSVRSAYSDYRTALFQTNSKNADESTKAINSFRQKWAALAASNAKAPPQYADDANYAATLSKVTATADTASSQVQSNKLAEAHETLEGIRDHLAELRERNGVIVFSDRMNAYHTKMEHIIGTAYSGFSAAGLDELKGDAAVLAYLTKDIAGHPPEEASDPAYKTLLGAVNTSVETLVQAARRGDAAAAKSAIDALKAPYSRFFLKFG